MSKLPPDALPPGWRLPHGYEIVKKKTAPKTVKKGSAPKKVKSTSERLAAADKAADVARLAKQAKQERDEAATVERTVDASDLKKGMIVNFKKASQGTIVSVDFNSGTTAVVTYKRESDGQTDKFRASPTDRYIVRVKKRS